MARRQTILTKQVMADIPAMIANGMEAAAIAEQLGCNLGTLRVRCSQAGISLRTAKHCRLSISPETMMGLRQYANVKGCTDVKLAIDLLKVIVQDNLYDAVLDESSNAGAANLKPFEESI